MEVTKLTNNHDIFRNKQDFAHEEFATELDKPKGRPRPREASSQESQQPSNPIGNNKGKKTPFADKLGAPGE